MAIEKKAIRWVDLRPGMRFDDAVRVAETGELVVQRRSTIEATTLEGMLLRGEFDVESAGEMMRPRKPGDELAKLLGRTPARWAARTAEFVRHDDENADTSGAKAVDEAQEESPRTELLSNLALRIEALDVALAGADLDAGTYRQRFETEIQHLAYSLEQVGNLGPMNAREFSLAASAEAATVAKRILLTFEIGLTLRWSSQGLFYLAEAWMADHIATLVSHRRLSVGAFGASGKLIDTSSRTALVMSIAEAGLGLSDMARRILEASFENPEPTDIVSRLAILMRHCQSALMLIDLSDDDTHERLLCALQRESALLPTRVGQPIADLWRRWLEEADAA